MLRPVVLLLFALHPSFARTSVAQDTLADTLRSGFRLSGNRLRRLPVDDPRHALVLIPGVRLTSPDIGVTPTAALLIRGSAAGRSNVYVDGAPLRFQTLGGAGVGLAPNAIADVSVLTGVTPAFLGDASGGVIAYETRSGGERLAGDLRWDSDEPFSDASSVGYNRIEGVVGGPIARGGQLTFFLSSTLQGQRSSYRGLDAAMIPAYMPTGVDTTVNVGGTQVAIPLLTSVSSGLQRPLDWSTARRAQAKLQYRYGTDSRLSLTVLGGDVQQRAFPGQLVMDSALYTGRRLRSAAAILNWQHEFGTWHGGPLKVDINLSLVGHRDISGPLDTASELATRDPGLGIDFRSLHFAGANILDLPTNDVLIRAVRTLNAVKSVPFAFQGPATQSGRRNPYGMSTQVEWPNFGLGGTLSDAFENRVQGRSSLEWRPNAGQSISLGVDAERSHVSSYSSDVVVFAGTDVFNARPKRVGVFAEDRLSFVDAQIELGVRYDRITPGGDLPVLPLFIASSGSALWNPNSATDDTAYANSVARVFRSARSQSVVSPRIRLTHRVGSRTTVRLGYSRTFEPPSWRTFFVHSNNDLAFTYSGDLVARDIDFARVSSIEGVVHAAVGHYVIDVSAYRQILPRYDGRLTTITDPRDPSKQVALNALSVFDDVNVEGIDLGLNWTEGWLTAVGTYSINHTTSQPGTPPANEIAAVTRHSAALAATIQVPDHWKEGSLPGAIGRGMSILVMARAQNGEPYTRLVNNGIGTVAPESVLTTAPLEPLNASRLPWFKRLDLRIAKSVRTGGHDWSVYLDARNLLNFSNAVGLFAETADTANPLNRERTIGSPANASGEFGALWDEAQTAGALAADRSVDLTGCASWGSPADCVALTRVERRFGNGDKLFTLAEQQRTFNAFYHDFFGAWRFYAPGRTIRIGMELAL